MGAGIGNKGHLSAFSAKMENEGLARVVIDTFGYYYQKVVSGETGLIPDSEIQPLDPQEFKALQALQEYAPAGRRLLGRSINIVLNGGLGTSMGLTGPKSLLEVSKGRSFLEIILRQSAAAGVTVALMNSFSTHQATLAALARLNPVPLPHTFLQHKYPKILQKDFHPAVWPKNPDLEWNPPGHGDIYTALLTSGMLQDLLDQGICYAMISNADNLGATLDPALLGYFAENHLPFMMEIAQRTPADKKGGHLARHKNGYLLLREIAQCAPEEQDAFQDIRRYRFFNTNSVWVNLADLKTLVAEQGCIRLPMIVNPKSVDPRDAASPAVYQIETAMGAAIALFKRASAVRVPDSRFCPVKKCNELMAVRSDCFSFSEDGQLRLNPARKLDRIQIDLDPRFYAKVDEFEQRFPQGVPSLVECESLTVKGDVCFEGQVTLKGKVVIENQGRSQARIRHGTVIAGALK